MNFKDIVEDIKDFTDNKELMDFFEINDYKPTTEKGWFKLINTKNKRIERMEITKDKNDKRRIHFIGENWHFSLNRDKNDNIYLDHLLIGNIAKEEFTFSYRYNIGKNEIIIKLVDDKNIKHTYWINESSVSIERQSVKDKIPEYKDKYYNIKEYAKQKDEYKYEHFHIYKEANDNTRLAKSNREYANNCLKEFLILEKTCISITSYIEKRISFLSSCINEASYHDVKLYEIKRETNPKSAYKRITTDNTKIYKISKAQDPKF